MVTAVNIPARRRSFSQGGPNSLDRFASSYSRAQSFFVIPPSDKSEDVDVQSSDSESFDIETRPLLTRVRTPHFKAEIVGQSTLPQTVLNSVNVLVGIGLLSLPLAFHYSGWLMGSILLTFSAIVTMYSAHLLARCLDTDISLVTYADIAYAAYGNKVRVLISVLFSLELTAALVALIIVFADSLHALIPTVGRTDFKIIGFLIVTPLSFLPLKLLSFTSILGILGTLTMVFTVMMAGCLKREAPGSLRHPMPTHLLPMSWKTFPLSFGLLLAPFGGHAVFPNIYRDMRHPQKYGKGLNYIYSFSVGLFILMSVLGLLMFGDGILEEVTSNILQLKYPSWVPHVMIICLVVIPVTKCPLSSRPMITTVEAIFGLESKTATSVNYAVVRSVLKGAVRVLVNMVILGIAILVPEFDRIMAFLGSALCYNVCITLPIFFYQKICADRIGRRERWMQWVLVGLSMVLSITGTISTGWASNESR